ncbi:MAG: HIT domain-containing protein, partial [Phreatobacter sp.]|nr:HIT domain-containing protein [Phreatobacter sp.]
MTAAFSLDSRLAADTVAVTDLMLCQIRLMNDATYPWLILVPRREGAVEIVDLAPEDRVQLMEEIATVS